MASSPSDSLPLTRPTATHFERPRDGSAPTTLFGWATTLPPELAELSRTRLRAVTYFLAVIQLAETGFWAISGDAYFRSAVHWIFVAPLFTLASATVGYAATRVSDTAVRNLILAYSLAMNAVLAWASFVLFRFDSPPSSPMLTPGATWVAIFPLLVPNDRPRVMFATLLGAMMDPLVFLLEYGTGGVSELGLSWHTFYGNGAAVLIALLASSILYRLGDALNAARKVGRYRLVEKLGEGGMGEVWRAQHDHLRRPAAVKLIRADYLSATAQRRFELEAQLTAELGSPHTVAVYDFGPAADGSFYYVMELLEGEDLHALVAREGPLDETRIRRVLRQMAHSLAEAHCRGLVHRDVKPANVMLCRQGLDEDFVKVLDFGLVKTVEPGMGRDAAITGERAVPGTPAFMAPEQVGSEEVGPPADIYALGCVAFWLATGRFVFEGKSPVEIMVRHSHDAPPDVNVVRARRAPALAPLGEDLVALIDAMLAKSADARPSALDVQATLTS